MDYEFYALGHTLLCGLVIWGKVHALSPTQSLLQAVSPTI